MKHYLSMDQLTTQDIACIFGLADQLKVSNKKPLEGKTCVLFFPESSIRTRLSFEKGIGDLGGQTVLFPPTTLDKREAHKDVVGYINNWADAIVVRHRDFALVKALADQSDIPIVNAMTGLNHPCEILSDLYAISKLRSDFRELTYTFVGEQGNICASWVKAASVFGFKLNHVSTAVNRIKGDDSTYLFTTHLEDVLKGTDIVLTDPLSKDMRNEDYYLKYQITFERMKLCKEGAMLNPCPPFFRGEEVSADVIESAYFVGYDFKKDLLYVQQAIILYCMGITNI